MLPPISIEEYAGVSSYGFSHLMDINRLEYTEAIIYGLMKIGLLYLAVTLVTIGFLNNSSESSALALATILFLPIILIDKIMVLIITCVLCVPMVGRAINAKLSLLWGLAYFPLAYLSVRWLEGWFKIPHDTLLTPFPFPWYMVAFIALVIFLGKYDGGNNRIYREEHSPTFWARIGAGLSAVFLIGYYLPILGKNGLMSRGFQLTPEYKMQTGKTSQITSNIPSLDFSFSLAMLPALFLIICLIFIVRQDENAWTSNRNFK